MSIFDRLGNLGKGLIQSTLNADSPISGDNSASRQAQLQQAFDEGLLTAEEYRNRLRELSARLAARVKGEDVGAVVGKPTPATESVSSDPVLDAIRKSKQATARARTTTAETIPASGQKRSLDTNSTDVGEDREWEVRGPVKRTL